jgi:hypothetical protein
MGGKGIGWRWWSRFMAHSRENRHMNENNLLIAYATLIMDSVLQNIRRCRYHTEAGDATATET